MMRPPRAAGDHRLRGGLADVEGARQVDRDDAVERRLVGLGDRLPVRDARVRADDVERAEVGLNRRDQRVDLARAPDTSAT